MSRTNDMRKEVTDFAQRDNEMFSECWERFKDLLLKCPHHGFEVWRLVQYFYNDLVQEDRSMIESMKGGRFLGLNELEAHEFLENLSESSQQWDHSQRDRNTRRAGLHEISSDTSINMKLDALTRKIEALTMSKPVEPVLSIQNEVCNICASPIHCTPQCPTYQTYPDQFPEQANVMYDNTKFGNTYNPNWRNHPNLSWRPNPPQQNFGGQNNFSGQNNIGNQNSYRPPFQNPQTQPRSFDQPRAQPSLEDTLKTFMQATTSHVQTTSQAISRIETQLGQQATQIGQLANQLADREKGKLPSQSVPNPRGQNHQPSTSHEQVQAITTLRSGRQVDNNVANPDVLQDGAEDLTLTDKALPEEEAVTIPKESVQEPDVTMYIPKAPFPQRLQKLKKDGQYGDILEPFKHVQINIPFLDVIKQVSAYAKFLKDLVTAKRKTNVPKKAFMTEQVSSVILNKYPIKCKDPGSPTISCLIGNFPVNKALLDLGASINLLPYSTYLLLGLGDLKPTNMRIQLADRSIRIARGIVEDVLIKIENFYFPVDFIVLDTEPVNDPVTQIKVILGRPF